MKTSPKNVVCSGCGEEKYAYDFENSRHGTPTSVCKQCRAKRRAELRGSGARAVASRFALTQKNAYSAFTALNSAAHHADIAASSWESLKKEASNIIKSVENVDLASVGGSRLTPVELFMAFERQEHCACLVLTHILVRDLFAMPDAEFMQFFQVDWESKLGELPRGSFRPASRTAIPSGFSACKAWVKHVNACLDKTKRKRLRATSVLVLELVSLAEILTGHVEELCQHSEQLRRLVAEFELSFSHSVEDSRARAQEIVLNRMGIAKDASISLPELRDSDKGPSEVEEFLSQAKSVHDAAADIASLLETLPSSPLRPPGERVPEQPYK